MGLAQKHLYTFEVDKNATKKEVAKAVADYFKVKVISVKTINIKPKKKQQRTKRGHYTTQASKKALVQIPNNQKIPLFEAGKEEKVEIKTAESEEKKEKGVKKIDKKAKLATKKKGKV